MEDIVHAPRSSVAATRAILQMAGNQHGIVSRRQLIDAGFAPRMIEERVATGRLTPVFPGVYGLSSENTSRKGMWLAATMSCGLGVVLSHRSARQLWNIGPDFSLVELLSPSMRTGKVTSYLDKKLIVHQTRSLPDGHVTRIEGIPVTTVSRTLIDLAAVSTRREVSAAFNEADRMGLLDLPEMVDLIALSRGRQGVEHLRTLVKGRDPRNRRTRSELESIFLRLCRDHGLPMPLVNVDVLGFEVDCFWPDVRFVVELDGLAFHSSGAEIEQDRRRDARLQGAGYLVLRLTYRDVTESPQACAATVTTHLRRAKEILPAEPH